MQPVKGALSAAGNCSIPLTLVVLGAYFYPIPTDVDKTSIPATAKSSSILVGSVTDLFKLQNLRANNFNVTEDRPGETKTVVIAVLSRMIITPILLLPLMVLSAMVDLHAIFEE
jgi:predicted permease